MKFKTLLLVILSVGVTFNMIGRATAEDVRCIHTAAHETVDPVCAKDIPLGPRFRARR